MTRWSETSVDRRHFLISVSLFFPSFFLLLGRKDLHRLIFVMPKHTLFYFHDCIN